MTLLVPNGGEEIALGYLVGKTVTVRDLVYRLFASNITPAESDNAATYTANEATLGGYVTKTIAGASWTITPGAPTEAAAAAANTTWTFTGPTTPATIFGYFVTRATDADLVLAEVFTSFTPTNNGDQIILTPKITCD